MEAGHFRQAVRRLRPPLDDSSDSYTQADRQRMAHWLARAYLGEGRSQKAFSVLRRGGAGTVDAEGSVNLQLADTYIREALGRMPGRDQERVVRLYLRILERSGENLRSDADRAVLRRHLREVAVVLPKEIRTQTGVSFDPATCEVNVDPEPNAGDLLVKWWRQQDVLPATRHNERIYEHLQRVAHAREHYTHEGRLDDRGKIYIRLGEPHRDVSIGMKHIESVDAGDTRLRRNEFWTYHHVHERARYLFVEIDPNYFQVGGADDLFPPDMKTGITGATARSQGQALEYLYEMERALRELATFHADYMSQATDVSNRAAWARDNEQYNIGSDPIEGPAGNFVRSMESKLESFEHQRAQKRAETVPPSYTSISENVPEFPIASRTARFLTPEGETRVELYWSAPTSGLALTEDLRERINQNIGSASTTLVQAVAVRETEDHVDAELRKKQFLVESSGQGQAILPPQTFSMVTGDSLFHLAMQWDQYSIREAGDRVQTGPVLRRQADRRDTLRALRNDPETLEMSDLKVLTVPDSAPATAVTSDAAIPYPFETIRTEAPFALNFQVYHLGMEENGRTRYTVSYGVRQETDGGGFLGLFGGGDEQETTTTTTYEGDSRRTDEYIVLNLDDFADDRSGSLDVVVKVTDEVTGQQVERSLSLKTIASDDS